MYSHYQGNIIQDGAENMAFLSENVVNENHVLDWLQH